MSSKCSWDDGMSLSVDERKATESMGIATKAGIFVFGSSIFIEIYERSRSFDSWLVKRKMLTISQSRAAWCGEWGVNKREYVVDHAYAPRGVSFSLAGSTVNLDHERSMPMPPSAMAPEGSACNLNGRDTQQVSPGVVGQQHRLTRSLISVGSSVCRICHTNTAKEPLISPCRCKGTLAYVHLSCLERWLNQSCRTYCELCRYYFNAVETPRYRCRTWPRVVISFMDTCRPESLRIWISHPRNRRNIESDLLILTLLTIVTVGLAAVCFLGMRYFIIEGNKIGISKPWTRGAIWFFLTVVILGYVTTVYLLCRDQVSPWYRWWKSTVNVRLVVDPQLLRRRPSDESSQDRESHDESRETAMSVVDTS
ncbi:MARH3 ligase, partial [Pseudoatta argentina]